MAQQRYTITGFVIDEDTYDFKDTTTGNATTTQPGFMSAADKVSLDDVVQAISNMYTKAETDAAISQATANTQLSPSYDTSKIESITAYRNGRIVFVSMQIAAGALPAGYSYIQCNLGVSFVAQPNIVFCSQGTADDAKVFGGYFLSNTLQIRASASNSGRLLATFVGITS